MDHELSMNHSHPCKAGGVHRQGGRRERNGQQILKESEGGITGAELANKITKRGRGSVALGSNEV